MANFRYFADFDEKTIELTRVSHDGSSFTSAKHFSGYVDGAKVQATRRIEFKSSPSRHECDARCYNATGKVMRCECACGGKNHGRGAFNCEAA